MPRVMTRCESTGKVVHTVLRLQPPAFLQLKGLHGFRCSACDLIHHWEKDAAWLEE